MKNKTAGNIKSYSSDLWSKYKANKNVVQSDATGRA